MIARNPKNRPAIKEVVSELQDMRSQALMFYFEIWGEVEDLGRVLECLMRYYQADAIGDYEISDNELIVEMKYMGQLPEHLFREDLRPREVCGLELRLDNVVEVEAR